MATTTLIIGKSIMFLFKKRKVWNKIAETIGDFEQDVAVNYSILCRLTNEIISMSNAIDEIKPIIQEMDKQQMTLRNRLLILENLIEELIEKEEK